MASTEAKAVRRALALNELDRLSVLLAEKFEIELPDLRPTHRDPDLQRIQRVEAINDLLMKVLQSVGVDTETEKQSEESEASNLDEMTKAQLLEEAERRGVEISKSHTKAKIIEALNA